MLFDHGHFELVERVSVRIGKTVPTPTAENTDRHCFFVELSKSLQSCDVEIEGEFAVTDGHGAIGIDLMHDHVVPAD